MGHCSGVMLKCECPVEAGGWAGEGEHGAKPGRPGNVRTEQRRWGRVSKDRRQGLVGGGRLHEKGTAHPEHRPISTDSIRRGGGVRTVQTPLRGPSEQQGRRTGARGPPRMSGGFQLGRQVWMGSLLSAVSATARLKGSEWVPVSPDWDNLRTLHHGQTRNLFWHLRTL